MQSPDTDLNGDSADSDYVSNPFSSGGGGVRFENHVQAPFLALMLVGVALRAGLLRAPHSLGPAGRTAAHPAHPSRGSITGTGRSMAVLIVEGLLPLVFMIRDNPNDTL